MRRPVCLMLVLLALSPVGCSSSRQPATTFEGAMLPPGVHAHGFALTDQHGASISLDSYRGRVRLLAFLSASQRASSLVAQQIRGALDELEASGLRAVTLIVSTDAADTPARAQRFLESTSLASRAHYLIGPPSQLRALWRAYGVVPASAGEAAFLQSTPVLLVDRAGMERVGFAVEQLTPESLAHDLHALLG